MKEARTVEEAIGLMTRAEESGTSLSLQVDVLWESREEVCSRIGIELKHNKTLRVLDLSGERITYEELCNILL